MPNINLFLLENIAFFMIVGLLLVIILLAIIAFFVKKERSVEVMAILELDASDQIEQIQQAASHYADVSSVVAMVRQLDELDADSVALLGSYPESVRAAAWLHYINSLGSDLQVAQKRLSDAHQEQGDFTKSARFNAKIEPLRVEAQQHVDTLRAKLDTAIEHSSKLGLLPA